MTKVVGFDLDDTLVAEVLFLKSGSHHIAKWLHDRYSIIPTNRIQTCVETAAMTRQNHYSALERLIREYGLSDRVDMKTIVAEFRSHMPDPEIYHPAPSLRNTLIELRSNPEIKTVIVTDGRSVTLTNNRLASGLS